MRFTHNDQQYETVGYERLEKGMEFIDAFGSVSYAVFDAPHYVRLVVRPVCKKHTFGGIRFRETGEKPRQLSYGEFGVDPYGWFMAWTLPGESTAATYTPIVPVEICES